MNLLGVALFSLAFAAAVAYLVQEKQLKKKRLEGIFQRLPPLDSLDKAEHKFLLATGNVGYQWEQAGVWFVTGSGDDREWHYPLGRYMDRFGAQGGPGLLLLHAQGNTFIRDLRHGERILIQPSGLIYKDPSVGMYLHFEYPHGQYWFSSARWQAKTTWLTLQGPGRVAIQSVFERPELAGAITQSSGATTHYW